MVLCEQPMGDAAIAAVRIMALAKVTDRFVITGLLRRPRKRMGCSAGRAARV